MTAFSKKRLDQLFTVKSGDVHAAYGLEHGDVPLVSCGEVDHGLVGFFDIPEERRHKHCLTVAYNGSWPLLTKFRPYEFGAKDDVAVLTPLSPMADATLLYIAAQLNAMTWRYSYYRHCYQDKVKKTMVAVPVNADGSVDEAAIAPLCQASAETLAPKKATHPFKEAVAHEWRNMGITTLFDIDRGDFHSLAALDPGDYPTVSRIDGDNGVVGLFDKPDGVPVYPAGLITVSTVGGDAFVQLAEFIATDNVLVLTPKIPMRPSMLFLAALMLNQQKWRYSYGRQCYKRKFEATRVWMPVDSTGNLDHEAAETLAVNTTYWPVVANLAVSLNPPVLSKRAAKRKRAKGIEHGAADRVATGVADVLSTRT